MTHKAASKSLYDHPSDMEPLLPGDGGRASSDLALTLIRGAERLRSRLHPITRKLVADLVRSMNSYYSNLIEGHRTRPRDIDAAIRKDFSRNPDQRSLQIQHVAHMEVQAEMEARLPAMTTAEICSTEFLCWLHEGFYRRLPEEFRRVEDEKGKSHAIQPGELRRGEVSVGRHMAPASKKLGEFLKRYADFYGPLVSMEPGSLVAASSDLDPSVPGWQRPGGPAVHPRVVHEGRRGQRWTMDDLAGPRPAEGGVSGCPGQCR